MSIITYQQVSIRLLEFRSIEYSGVETFVVEIDPFAADTVAVVS